jgi:DUF3072 family protein
MDNNNIPIENEQRQSGQNQDQSQLNNDNKARSNTIKDPEDWTTGDEPMTGAQRSYLKTLSDEAGEDLNENLTKAEASKRINELQQKTGRGINNGGQ